MRTHHVILTFLMFLLFQTQLIQSIHTVKTFNNVTFVVHASDWILNVSYYELVYDEWSRNPITDLPRCHSNLDFKISSVSNFSDVYFTFVLGESSVTYEIPTLQKGLNTVSGFSILSEYEDFGVPYTLKTYLTVKTGNGFMYTHKAFPWTLYFPRYLNEEIASLYITPQNPTVRELTSNISGWPKWLALLNWVASNIEYKDDSEVHGISEFWQLPTETIQLRTGDCEDYAILLCSLYRASGYDENSAYVVLGYTENEGHAWVRIYAQVGGIGTWINIEPQVGGILTVFYGMINLATYEEAFQFNDVYFERLK